MTTSGRERTVWVFGPIPPPVHGAARVTDQVRQAVEDTGAVRVVVVDTGGGTGGPSRRAVRMLSGLARLIVARRNSGAVYVGGAGGPTLWYQAVVVLIGRLRGLRAVFHHHSYAYIDSPFRSMRALTRAGGAALTHVVLCEGMGQGLRRRYPAVGEVLICSNAGLMTPVVASPRQREEGAGLTLGHLGNLSLEKGLAEVLDTLRLALSRGEDVRLLLGGLPATPAAARAVASAFAELGDAMTMLGAIPPDEIDTFYREIDVFVFPSRYVHEAEPLVVLDASRHGVPSIAFAVGCLPGMVAPEHLVPVDGHFADIAVDAIGDLSAARSSAVAAGFGARREAALSAHAELVAVLAG